MLVLFCLRSLFRQDGWQIWMVVLPALCQAAFGQSRPMNNPVARSNHSLTFDATRQQIVLFGGSGSGAGLGDTWVWNGIKWTEKLGRGPSPHSFHSLIYDVARQQIVLFGG